jgi:adenylyltransferase/sulfurtransferase
MNTRYTRQANIIGMYGQQYLKNTNLLCIGAGGLGTLVSSFLVAAGVGRITIMDKDIVEISNLTRQITYHEKDSGISKVVVLQRYLQQLNCESQINILDVDISHANVDSIVPNHDIVIDCSDNFITKYLISDSCSLHQKPLITASIDGFHGQVMVLLPELCYRCVFTNASSNNSCFDGDVIGPSVGIVASCQANEVLKLITSLNNQSKLIQMDCLNNITREFKITPDYECVNNHRQELAIDEKPEPITLNEAISLHYTQNLKFLDMRKNIINKLPFETIIFDMHHIHEFAKEQPLAIICNYGYRSRLVAMKLKSIGYTKVYYVEHTT